MDEVMGRRFTFAASNAEIVRLFRKAEELQVTSSELVRMFVRDGLNHIDQAQAVLKHLPFSEDDTHESLERQ